MDSGLRLFNLNIPILIMFLNNVFASEIIYTHYLDKKYFNRFQE
jgi:hypothetical protein